MPRVDPAERLAFAKARRAENQYGIQLRRLARTVSDIIQGHPVTGMGGISSLVEALGKYAALVQPWASTAAARMLREVSLRDTAAWETHSRQMGYALRREIREAPTGAILAQLQAEQVRLITSIPLEAAKQVHEKALAGLSMGQRFDAIAKDLFAVGDITKARATLIARTEVGRAASNLTQARAQYVGSDGYIWRTIGDVDVRPEHKKLEGKFIRWDSPPKTDKGLAPYHAGCGPNCRCYAEPVIPKRFEDDAS